MAAQETGRERLARMVKKRRTALGLSVSEAARRAGIDRATWTSLEDRARATQDRHFGAVERTLGWATGDCETILAGGSPTLRDAQPAQEDVAERRAELISLSVEQFVARFRGAESVFLDAGDPAKADRWLRNALAEREEAIHEHYREIMARLDAAKRDAS